MRNQFLVAYVTLASVLFALTHCPAYEPVVDAGHRTMPKNPPELGKVTWLRGFESAASKATTDNKPLLVLFQEVPGCSTCVNYGTNVLGHPLIVEAAESLFIPVCIYNNIKGDDERVLKLFSEPAWNNPVVRIMTADKRPLTERVAQDYSISGLASAMCAAIEKLKQPVPEYLRLLAQEESARKEGVEKATFAMHCFWEGEGALGSLDGVVGTMPGFVDGLEVVEVEFDPKRVPFEKLLRKAQDHKCAGKVFARSDDQLRGARKVLKENAVRSDETMRPDKEPKYYLLQTPYRHVPMTSLQACRVNAALGQKQDPGVYLSPRQLALLDVVMAKPNAGWPNAIGAQFAAAWTRAAAIAGDSAAR